MYLHNNISKRNEVLNFLCLFIKVISFPLVTSEGVSGSISGLEFLVSRACNITGGGIIRQRMESNSY